MKDNVFLKEDLERYDGSLVPNRSHKVGNVGVKLVRILSQLVNVDFAKSGGQVYFDKPVVD
jgi:hypothetical protein